ncbi:MAG: nucleotidyltransferase family protein [Rhizomicrobium sp.]
MTRDEVMAELRRHEIKLKRAGVIRLYLFGSTARGEARPRCDVDLFFDYEKGKFGIFALMEVQDLATRILGPPADIMTGDSVHPVLRPRIEAEAVRISR